MATDAGFVTPAKENPADELDSATELARYAATFQEYLTPHNVCLFVLIREYLVTCHWGVDENNSVCSELNTTLPELDHSMRSDDLVRTPDEKFQLYNFILEMMESTQLFPMSALMNRGRDCMKKVLSKLVELKIKQFFTYSPKESHGPFHQLDIYLATSGLQAIFRDSEKRNVTFYVTPSSVFGLFMRKVVYAYQSCTFEQAYDFMSRLRMFCFGQVDANDTFTSAEDYHRRQREDAELNEHGMLERNKFQPVEDPTSWQYDRQAVNAFVSEQLHLLEHNSTKAIHPKQLEEQITVMLHYHPHVDSLYFLKFMNAVRRKDRSASEAAIRKYFALKVRNEWAGVYDVLSIASLLHYFSYKDEANIALKEALRSVLEVESADRPRGHEDMTFVQLKSDVRKLLLSGAPPKLTLARLAADRDKAYRFKLYTAVSLQQCSSVCHLYGLHTLHSVLSQSVLLADFSENGIPMYNEPIVYVLSQFAILLSEKGMSTFALQLIDKAKEHLVEVSPLTEILNYAENEIVFTKSLYQQDYKTAEDCIGQISVCFSESEGKYKKALLAFARGQYHSVRELCTKIISSVKEEKGALTTQIVIRAKLLIAETEIDPSISPFNAMAILDSCAKLAESCHMSTWNSLIGLYRAAACYVNGELSIAADWLNQVSSYIGAHTSLCLRARFHLLFAQVNISLATKSSNEKLEQKSDLFQSAEQHLQKSLSMFLKLDYRSKIHTCYCWLAFLMNNLEKYDSRNFYSRKSCNVELIDESANVSVF